MTDKEVMQMALDALEQITPDWRTSIDKHEQLNNSIEALRACLAQYKKEWVGLTDAEVEKVFFDMGQFAKIDLKTFARAIETKLKEKNNG